MKTIFIIFWVVCLYSCTLVSKVAGNVKRNFPCYDDKHMLYDTMLDFNSYYRLANITTRYKFIEKSGFFNLNIKSEQIEDTLYTNIIFFKDGIVLYGIDSLTIETTDIDEYRHCYAWGSYYITNDTIKICFLYVPDDIFRNTNVAWEILLKFIDKKTILYIESRPIHKVNKYDMDVFLKAESIRKDKYFPVSSIPLKYIPDSDLCWLKKEKWFWCNESDWKAYMEKINKQKEIMRSKKE